MGARGGFARPPSRRRHVLWQEIRAESMWEHASAVMEASLMQNIVTNNVTTNLPILTIHIPKAGGTLLELFGLVTTCQLHEECGSGACADPAKASRTNDWQCEGRWRKSLKHNGHLSQCGLLADGAAHAGRAGHSGLSQCATMLRHPVDRAVSGWFYHGHHPGVDFYRAWPCLQMSDCNCTGSSSLEYDTQQCAGKRTCNAYLSERGTRWVWWQPMLNATCSASFTEYLQSISYSNIATRMLGDDEFAYAHTVVSDESLARAKGTLSRLPFVGILEFISASTLLYASTFGGSQPSDCLALWGRLRRLSATPVRLHVDGRTTTESEALQAMRQFAQQQNALDMELYRYALAVFCTRWNAAKLACPCVRQVLAAATTSNGTTSNELQRANKQCSDLQPRDAGDVKGVALLPKGALLPLGRSNLSFQLASPTERRVALVHVRKSGGTSFQLYLHNIGIRWEQVGPWALMPVPCLVQTPAAVFITILREPVRRHTAEFYYSGPGFRNHSSGRDPTVWDSWMHLADKIGPSHYTRNYYTRAHTGICTNALKRDGQTLGMLPKYEPTKAPEAMWSCSPPAGWVELLGPQSSWIDHVARSSAPSRHHEKMGGCTVAHSAAPSSDGWRLSLAKRVLDHFDVILLTDRLASSTAVVWEALGRPASPTLPRPFSTHP